MTEEEARERLNRIRARAEAERATRAEFKRRRDHGLARRHAAKLARTNKPEEPTCPTSS